MKKYIIKVTPLYRRKWWIRILFRFYILPLKVTIGYCTRRGIVRFSEVSIGHKLFFSLKVNDCWIEDSWYKSMMTLVREVKRD